MPKLVFAKEFLDDFAKLEPPVRQKVRELPDKFEHAAHTGVHLEKLTSARDDRVRTVRVDQFWRGVVVRLGEARYALLRVLAHEEANGWATRQRLGVNPVTGIVEILDVPAVEAKVEAVTAAQLQPKRRACSRIGATETSPRSASTRISSRFFADSSTTLSSTPSPTTSPTLKAMQLCS